MKKTMFHATIALVFGLSSAVAMAEAPSKDLIVKGAFEVPGCTVSQTEGGIYDFGSIPASTVKPGTATTALTPQKQTWTVNCDADTFLSFKVVDNQVGSVSDTSKVFNFGLGNINDTGKIGYYVVKLSDAKIGNGETAYVKYVPNGYTSGRAYSSFEMYPGSSGAMTWAPNTGDNFDLSISNQFVMDMEVTPTLAGTTAMNGPITETVPLNGSLTLSYAFGL
jgi:hypothetical protein